MKTKRENERSGMLNDILKVGLTLLAIFTGFQIGRKLARR